MKLDNEKIYNTHWHFDRILQDLYRIPLKILLFIEGVEKKVRLKSPKLHTPRKVGTCHHPRPLPKMRESRYFKPQPHPTMWLRRGPGCCRPSNPWAVGPNSPLSPAPTCWVGLTISSPLVFPPTLRWESLRVQWGARNNLRCKVCVVPAVQWRPWTRVANPGNPGKGGQCSLLPWQVKVYLWKKSLVGGGAHTYSTPSWSS